MEQRKGDKGGGNNALITVNRKGGQGEDKKKNWVKTFPLEDFQMQPTSETKKRTQISRANGKKMDQ